MHSPAMARAKNSASPADICKILRAELMGLDAGKYLSPKDDDVCQEYAGLIVSLLKATPRLNTGLLKIACVQAFQVSESEAHMFSSKIIQCVSYCRNKAKSFTTGSKTAHGVKLIVKTLNSFKTPCVELTASLKKRALSRMHSDESKSSNKRVKPIDGNSTCKIAGSSSRASQSEICAIYGLKEKVSLPLMEDDFVCVSDDASSVPSQVSPQKVQEIHDSPKKTNSNAVWLNSESCCLQRLSLGGVIHSAKMEQGKDGFCDAFFDEESPIKTEMPNLTLYIKQEALKRPAAAKKKVMKKPSKQEIDSLDGSCSEEQSQQEDKISSGGLTPNQGGNPPIAAASKTKAAKPKVAAASTAKASKPPLAAASTAKASKPPLAAATTKTTTKPTPAAASQSPAAKGLVAAASETKTTKPPFEAAAAIHPKNITFKSEVWGECKAEFYKDKSYCRAKSAEGKWICLVSCQKKQHHNIVQTLISAVKAGASRESLWAQKRVLEATD